LSYRKLCPLLVSFLLLSIIPMVVECSEIADENWSYRGYSVRDLLAEREGFAKSVTGGLNGKVYHVTTLADGGPGSLRAALENSEKLWIVFDVNGTIWLDSPIYIFSDKTIDGRGAQIVIRYNGFRIMSQRNIIIAYIRLEFGGGDAIGIEGESTNIWIHHCDIVGFGDGAIDITKTAGPSVDVTISWCRIWCHKKVMLIGSDALDETVKNVRVTLHHNYFFMTGERNPRVRYGKVDAFNNYLYGWADYGMGTSMYGELLAEANIFEALDDADAVVPGVGTGAEPSYPSYVRLKDNLLLNGAIAREREPERVFKREDYYTVNVEPATEELKIKIMSLAGSGVPFPPRIMVNVKSPDFYPSKHYINPKSDPFVFSKTGLDPPIYVGNLTRFYAIIEAYKSPLDKLIFCEWDFGDGTKITLNESQIVLFRDPSVKHAYSQAGRYIITLAIKTAGGQTIVVTEPVNIMPAGGTSSEPGGDQQPPQQPPQEPSNQTNGETGSMDPALQEYVSQLQNVISNLRNQIASLQSQITELEVHRNNLQNQLANLLDQDAGLRVQASNNLYMGIGAGAVIGLIIGIAATALLKRKQ